MVISTIDKEMRDKKFPHQFKNKTGTVSRIIAGVTATTLGLAGSAFMAAPAYANPGYSQATAQYLSGTLLDLSLEDIAELEGVSAQAMFGDEATEIQTRDLTLNVLGDTLVLQTPGGVQIPLNVADAGVVGQYASASPSGDSTAVSGLVTDDGTIGLAPDAANPPGPLQLDLTDLLGTDITDEIANLTLTTGVNTASANQTPAGVSTGDYSIASLEATMTSPVLASVSGELTTATTNLEETVNTTLGPDGTLTTDLTNLLSATGLVESEVAFTVDLDEAVGLVLSENQILGAEGPVTIDLSTGLVTVNIAELYTANGIDINSLEPGTELLSPELIDFVSVEIDELVDSLVTEINDTISTTLNAASLTLDVNVLGDEAEQLVTVNISGTLEEIANGTGVSEITIADGVTVDAAVLTGSVTSLVSGVLDSEIDVADLTASLDALDPIIAIALGDLVSLQANVQETSTDGAFTETALRLSILNTEDDLGNLLMLNLASATVGPNGLGADPNNPDTVIVNFTPESGPEAGGTDVTITGSGFTGAEEILFGTTPATSFEVVSDTEIVATSPAGTGSVFITVGGTEFGDATTSNPFTYVPAGTPTESATLTPTEGSEDGGTLVVIEGTGLSGTEEVLFGETPGTDVTVVSDNVVVVTTPAGTGTVPVTLIDGEGNEIIAEEEFSYVDALPPVEDSIYDVAPNFGPEAGGTEVAIVGNGFTGATEVSFGANVATFEIVSDGLIVATSPAGVGTVPITVTAAGGEEIAFAEEFSYIPETVVGSFTPNQGPETGGTEVTIIGEGFTGAEEVLFGENPATSFEVISDTEIVATSPAGTGSVVITVVGGNGNTGISEAPFTYVAAEEPIVPPAIDSITPAQGSTSGGTVVTIIGSGFTGADGVLFGTTPATNFEVISDTEIRATSPAGTGSVFITVVGTDRGDVTSTDAFEYVPAAPAANANNGGNAGNNNANGQQASQLAKTGSDFSGSNILMLGVLFLASGGAFYLLSRRFSH